MRKPISTPIPKVQLQNWMRDNSYNLIEVQNGDTSLLVEMNEALPEIIVLFVNNAGGPPGSVEVCGMYDKRTHEFRFVTDQLAAVADGFSTAERWPGNHTSNDVCAKINQYAQNVVTQKGYQFQNSTSAKYAEVQKSINSALSAMQGCAAMFAAQGKTDTVLDIRDLAQKMLYFWRDPIYLSYEKGHEIVERRYLEAFDQAVSAAAETKKAPPLGTEKAVRIFQGLAFHAEEVVQNEDDFTLWECCRLAKRLAACFPDESQHFRGSFTPDYNEQFTSFGSQDREHLQAGKLIGKPFLLFNHPVPGDQLPEGWHSYHLAGRNIFNPDTLSKTVPEKNYLGTVVSPYVLIRASYQNRQIKDQFIVYAVYCTQNEFCEMHGLAQPEESLCPLADCENTGMTMGGMA